MTDFKTVMGINHTDVYIELFNTLSMFSTIIPTYMIIIILFVSVLVIYCIKPPASPPKKPKHTLDKSQL